VPLGRRQWGKERRCQRAVAAAEGMAAAAVQRTERRTAGREETTEQY